MVSIEHRLIYTLLVTLLPAENFGVHVSEMCKTFETSEVETTGEVSRDQFTD